MATAPSVQVRDCLVAAFHIIHRDAGKGIILDPDHLGHRDPGNLDIPDQLFVLAGPCQQDAIHHYYGKGAAAFVGICLFLEGCE